MSRNSIIIKTLRILAAIIMLQTLYFKFTGQEESVFIFTQIGLEPYGRIYLGIFELISSIMLIIPRTSIFGAILGIGIMSGAILTHIFVLGIEIMEDGGKLFLLAITVWISCFVIIYSVKSSVLRYLKPFIHDKKISD